MDIGGRGKIGYITGETKRPVAKDPTYAIWDAENSMLTTWLVNFMAEEIRANYLSAIQQTRSYGKMSCECTQI